MALLTLPNTLTPGTFEDVGDVQENFAAVRSLINGSLDGDNLSQASGEALSVSSTNAPRRGRTPSAAGLSITSSTYVLAARCPTVVMPTSGLLHVSLWARAALAGFTAGTVMFAVQLNGVTARSRFGVLAAESGGLMELTISLMAGARPDANLVTANVDAGLTSLFSADTDPVDDQSNGHALGAPVPIAANAGAYTVDLVAKVGTATGFFTDFGSIRGHFTVRTEAF